MPDLPLDLIEADARAHFGKARPYCRACVDTILDLTTELRRTRADRVAVSAELYEIEALWVTDKLHAEDAEAAIARVRRWAVNGTYDAQHAASFRAALDGPDG